MAANQVGKTVCAGMELAMHLTGLYPEWWDGHRFLAPTKWWASGDSLETTRNNPQRILMGDKEEWGTGTIPKAALLDKKMSRGIANGVDLAFVKHVSGGVSQVQFKAYEQGREKWQGETLTGGVWFDEEPPRDIYTEGLTRTNAGGGIVLITFTPLQGITDIVGWFYPQPNSPDRGMVHMDITDALHYSEERAKQMIDSYPDYEREARAHGRPMLGTGRVFPVPQTKITVEPFEIPDYWPVVGGIDFGGWDHPTAAVLCAWDRDQDIFYVTREFKESEITFGDVATTLRRWGASVPFAWPHDGYIHDRSSGKTYADLFREAGIRMIREHATHAVKTGHSLSVEAGVAEVLERCKTGRFKVFKGCGEFLNEFTTYHRSQGKIVKKNDDLISATRYALMMRKFGRMKREEIRFPRNVGRDYDPIKRSVA